MPTARNLASWTALPATFITTLITSRILKATASPKDKGLLIVFKAASTFFVVLALTVIAINILFLAFSHTEDTFTSNRSESLANGISDLRFSDSDTLFSTGSDNRIATWRDGSRDTQGVPRSALAEYRQNEQVHMGKRDNMELKKESEAGKKKERKKIWKAIVKEFKPSRKSLLGGKREAVEEADVEES
ncbi:hypothetical protein CC86DRAFT_366943 [Ophiobolus disseminans]|uniref:Uncharacterized protein n=1 Tax=Ophiobolus disseminans TaxID=1469910 RepID=A0A6A7AE79_9PLEO|nr:hypothetical protein CC86DRAFT_366943 [Ophiobolus disseminans]